MYSHPQQIGITGPEPGQPVIREVRARRPPRGTAVPGRVRNGPGEEGCGGGVGVSHASGAGAARRGLGAGFRLP